jgi:hypothetical protein
MIEQQFVSLAEAMPADKYECKPTNGEFRDVRAFGEQIKHVACGNFAFFNEIEKKEPAAVLAGQVRPRRKRNSCSTCASRSRMPAVSCE